MQSPSRMRWRRSFSGYSACTAATSADVNRVREVAGGSSSGKPTGVRRRRRRCSLGARRPRPGARRVPLRAPSVRSSANTGRARAECQRQVEQHLGIGRALDVREQRRVDGDHQVTAQQVEAVDEPVVHEEPVAVPERVAVRLLDRTARRRADVRQEQRRLDVRREVGEGSRCPTPARRCGTRRGPRRCRTSRRRTRRRSSSRLPCASEGSARSARAGA